MVQANEKAKELVDKYEKEILKIKYHISGYVVRELSKQCALICVEEILNELREVSCDTYHEREYWKSVKEEISKL